MFIPTQAYKIKGFEMNEAVINSLRRAANDAENNMVTGIVACTE